eukprot:TRINITY_DN8151_c0_g2_i1.p1 TRINITY_DN8151_c0_g2~~TRINITY_DN8151_c0_g2_i1.p1  ORF type:complete len:328 (-),score=58.20 TRINITY_DN8151_c0_g2_i1:35-1018(-)
MASLGFVKALRKAAQGGSFARAFTGVDLSQLAGAKEFCTRLRGVMRGANPLNSARTFRPRPGDVVTLMTSKTGQTWTLAMLRKLSLGKAHTGVDKCLATDPAKFEEGAVPWLESHAWRGKLNLEQPGSLRVFKSHLNLSDVRGWPKSYPDARFLICLRQPHDRGLSYYKHLRGGYGDELPGKLGHFDSVFSPDDFALLKHHDYEQNLVDWIGVKDHPNVMVLFYEQTLADPRKVLRRLAEFVGVELDAEFEDNILDATNYDVMSTSGVFINVFPGGGTYGKGRKTLRKDTCAELDQRWAEIVEPATGARSYEQLYEQVTGETFPRFS